MARWCHRGQQVCRHSRRVATGWHSVRWATSKCAQDTKALAKGRMPKAFECPNPCPSGGWHPFAEAKGSKFCYEVWSP